MQGTIDKNIVDRRAPHRATGARRTLRIVREGLNNGEHEPARFRDELLAIHARMQRSARWPLLSLILLAGCSLTLMAPIGQALMAAWCIASLAAWYCNARIAAAVEVATAANAVLALAGRKFAWMQRLQGMLWATFVLLFERYALVTTQGTELAPGLSGPVLLGGLMLVGSGHVLWSHALPDGVAWIVAPPFVAISIVLGLDATSGNMVASASLLGAASMVAMFWMLGSRLLAYARKDVRTRMEKDHAFYESGEARSLSEEARRRAEEANMAKTRFLATMSHELRTPLNAILGFSEMMEQEVLGPLGNDKYREYVGDIHTSGAHLLKLINEILDLSRVEAGRYELREEAVDLPEVARDAMQMLKLKANDKELTIQLRCEPALPRLWADERAVRQVVLNLLSNAVKFTSRGGIIVIKVGWTGSGGQYVTVADNGPGIAAEEMSTVLSTFGQGSVALRVAEPGSGLGLPIVQAFMKLHDGRFELESKLRQGTEATILFPRRRVIGDDLASAAERTRQGFAQAG